MAVSVQLEVRGRIAYLTFVRPSIDSSFGREFLEAALAIDANDGIKAVLMTGVGRHFCLGGDLKAMASAGSGTQGYLSALTTHLHSGMTLLGQTNAPVIAAVNGSAAGAGFGLALGADLVMAASGAKFVAAYTGVALTPDAGCTYFLPRIVGTKRAMELFMTNRVLAADEALAWGIVNQVVPDAELTQAAGDLAERLASGPTGAFGAIKRLMGDSHGGLEAQLGRESRSIAARGSSAEGREGIAAFLEKRSPRYE